MRPPHPAPRLMTLIRRPLDGTGCEELDQGKMAEIRTIILYFCCHFSVARSAFESLRKLNRQMRLRAAILMSSLGVLLPCGPGNAQDRVQPVLPKSMCEKPCWNWSSWQSDPAFSFEGCMANCIPDSNPKSELEGRNQRLQEELQRRANEVRKKLEAR